MAHSGGRRFILGDRFVLVVSGRRTEQSSASRTDIKRGAGWKRRQRQSALRKDWLLSVPQRARAGRHSRSTAGTQADRFPVFSEVLAHAVRRNAAIQSEGDVRSGRRRRVRVPAVAAATTGAQQPAVATALKKGREGFSGMSCENPPDPIEKGASRGLETISP